MGDSPRHRTVLGGRVIAEEPELIPNLYRDVGVVDFPEYMKDVWHAPQLAAMLLAGVTIAVLGALLPARSAARTPIAPVLHTE
ncbi:hypothetical protein ACIRS3_36505 [Streptomyces virginiae]|uniref:hypothetical protein n=1 Tax=Streptomyces virginiae TaxID=1961 RepID=UPI00380A6DDB